MGDEAGLPALFQILAGVADEVRFGDERAAEVDEVADGAAHPDGVPPRAVDFDGRVGEVAGHEELRVGRACGVAHAARPRRVDQQDRPLRAARARREDLVAIDDVAALDLLGRRPEAHGLARRARLRLAAPRDPLVAALDDRLEPRGLLLGGRHPVEEHERVDVPLPAARQREVGLRELLRHHPQREHVAAVRAEAEAAVLFGHDRREQARLEDVREILGGEGRRLVVVGGARRELLAGQLARAVDQSLAVTGDVELRFDGATSSGSCRRVLSVRAEESCRARRPC